jgi:hypothetical protein
MTTFAGVYPANVARGAREPRMSDVCGAARGNRRIIAAGRLADRHW